MSWNKLTDKQKIAALMATGVSESHALFIVALESGEISGDVVEIDERGNEVGRDANPRPRPTAPQAE